MKLPVHIFVIESEKSKSQTSVFRIYDEITNALKEIGDANHISILAKIPTT
jgi:hypothetical protein